MKKIFSYMILGVLSAMPLVAQEDGKGYTLDRLIVEALDNNYDIQVSKVDLEIAGVNNTVGNAGMLPSLMWQSSLNNSFNDRYDGENRTGFLQNGVSLNWVLFNGFSAHIRKDRLESLEQLAGGNLSLVVENTIQAVVMAYYRTLFVQKQLSLLKEIMELSADRLKYVEDRLGLGAATSYDVLQARTAYLTDKAAYLEQEAAVTSMLRELKYLTGMEDGDELQLSGELQFDAPEFNLEVMISQLEEGNQSIRNQYMNLVLLEQQQLLEKRSRFPALSAAAGAGHNVYPGSLNSSSDIPGFSDGYFSYYVNFSLSFTLFDGNRINRNIEIARMEESIGQITLREMKHRLRNQLLNLFDTYRVRQELVQVGKENMEASRINMQLTEEKFRAGAVNSFNFRDVQLSYLQAAVSYYRTVLDLIDTHTELVRITGGIVEEYD
ncbi:TolC family protein [Thermophagus sp. OGC60D27]|uniref:TolC family protein n=1 Tax=Thermophagus sp. OGC60D27 TaxID=3458415 RepID=UPI0040383C00